MPLVFLHHLLNVSVQLADKRGFKHTKNYAVEKMQLIKQRFLKFATDI
jgi:hypothetical protein